MSNYIVIMELVLVFDFFLFLWFKRKVLRHPNPDLFDYSTCKKVIGTHRSEDLGGSLKSRVRC